MTRGLKKELHQNIEFLEIEKKDKQNKLLALDTIRNDTSSDQELRQVLGVFGDEIKSKEFINIYIALKDKKKISLVQSKQLREQITAFYEYGLTGIRDANTWHKKFVSDNIDPFILEHLPVDDNYEANLEAVKLLLNQSKFRNILTRQKSIYEGYVTSSENVTKLSTKLKVEIKFHLKK